MNQFQRRFNVHVFMQVDGSQKVGYVVKNKDGYVWWAGTGFDDAKAAMNAAVERIRFRLGVIATLEDLRFYFDGIPAPDGYQVHAG